MNKNITKIISILVIAFLIGFFTGEVFIDNPIEEKEKSAYQILKEGYERKELRQ